MIGSLLVLAAALTFTPEDAQIAYESAKGLVEKHTPRDAGTLAACRAANYILDTASAYGADVRRDSFTVETAHGPKRMMNLECSFVADPKLPWLVFVSHYDTKPGINCPGANDGASTTGLLIALARAIFRNQPQKGNILLLWTDGEECIQSYTENDGLWGARHAAAKYKNEGKDIRAVFCLDMLGDKDLQITVPANGTPKLRQIVERVGQKIGLKNVTLSKDVVIDDHVPFLDAGFRAVDLIDFQYEGPEGTYWHTPQDTMEHVSTDSLLKAGQLVVALINGFYR